MIGFLKRLLSYFIKPTIISVDGIIGSGKSTLLKKISEKTDIKIIPEPINIWLQIKDSDDKNILQKFYDDKYRYSYTMQNFAYITRTKMLIDTINSEFDKMGIIEMIKHIVFNKPFILITERSILTDKYVFAKMLYDDSYMTKLEYDLYNYWFDFFTKEYKIKNVIYVDTTCENALKRIKLRGRVEEEKINLEYLMKLKSQHDKWLTNCPYDGCHVLKLDINNVEEDLTSIESVNKYDKHINDIRDFIKTIIS